MLTSVRGYIISTYFTHGNLYDLKDQQKSQIHCLEAAHTFCQLIFQCNWVHHKPSVCSLPPPSNLISHHSLLSRSMAHCSRVGSVRHISKLNLLSSIELGCSFGPIGERAIRVKLQKITKFKPLGNRRGNCTWYFTREMDEKYFLLRRFQVGFLNIHFSDHFLTHCLTDPLGS